MRQPYRIVIADTGTGSAAHSIALLLSDILRLCKVDRVQLETVEVDRVRLPEILDELRVLQFGLVTWRVARVEIDEESRILGTTLKAADGILQVIEHTRVEDAVHLSVARRVVDVTYGEMGSFEIKDVLDDIRSPDPVFTPFDSKDFRAHLRYLESSRALAAAKVKKRALAPVPITHAIEIRQEFNGSLTGNIPGIFGVIGAIGQREPEFIVRNAKIIDCVDGFYIFKNHQADSDCR